MPFQMAPVGCQTEWVKVASVAFRNIFANLWKLAELWCKTPIEPRFKVCMSKVWSGLSQVPLWCLCERGVVCMRGHCSLLNNWSFLNCGGYHKVVHHAGIDCYLIQASVMLHICCFARLDFWLWRVVCQVAQCTCNLSSGLACWVPSGLVHFGPEEMPCHLFGMLCSSCHGYPHLLLMPSYR